MKSMSVLGNKLIKEKFRYLCTICWAITQSYIKIGRIECARCGEPSAERMYEGEYS